MSEVPLYPRQVRQARRDAEPLGLSAALPRSFPHLIHRNVQRLRGGLVFKAHRLVYHATGPAGQAGRRTHFLSLSLYLSIYLSIYIRIYIRIYTYIHMNI